MAQIEVQYTLSPLLSHNDDVILQVPPLTNME